MVSKLLYDFGIRLYLLAIHIASFFSPKAKQWINGRKGLFQEIQQKIKALPSGQTTIWMHCASLGEFEQGRPVIELLKAQYPNLRVIVSFFSPSGYEVRKNYSQADLVCYLPADTRKNAQEFIQILQPDVAIFVKYEFWYHHLEQLKRNGIPVLLISALFRSEQVFFRPYGKFFRRMLSNFQHIFVQNQISGELLKQINLSNYRFGGDSRVDRVADIAAAPKGYPIVAQFVGHTKTIIAGSTWQPDEKILVEFVNHHLPEDWKIIFAPHQINKAQLQQLQQVVETPSILYSEARGKKVEAYRVLLIDNVGMLAHLYQYGVLAYIGGGFGVGIHNTLEPIAFGLPLFFGPKYQKFEEANYLVIQGAAVVVHNKNDLQKGFEEWQDEMVYKKSAQKASLYIQNNQGASKKIAAYIQSNFLQSLTKEVAN